jgi:cytochrome c oxidase cbb3-type subunit I/II
MFDTRLRSPLALAGLAAVALIAATLVSRENAPAQELPKSAPAAPATELLTDADWPLTQDEIRGRTVYEKYCVGCHGESGRGDGPAARFLDPLPRDFQSGKFKFRSTAFGEAPLEADLMRTVTCGLPGSSMPGFPLVPEIQRREVVRYVLHLARLGRANRSVAGEMQDEGTPLEQLRRQRLPALRAEIENAPLHRIAVPPETESTPASVERGRALFATSCAACHGASGRGDGNSSHALRDDRGAVIRPRDFTTGVFRSGSTSEDVFVRIRSGLSGTPMPGFTDFTGDQVWDLVHFIVSLKDPTAAKPKMPPGCGHEGGTR